MHEHDRLTDEFEANRARLRAVAFRMLGSSAEADDAVQEAWLRLDRSGADRVENMPAWLTTVVARICLDMLRSRKSRREQPIAEEHADAVDPEREAVLADSVGLALLVVLEQLTPSERVAFVLHDMFDLPFDDIARVVGRSPDATRQLASRARRRVRGTDPDDSRVDTDRVNRRRVVDAFLAASRGGDFAALLRVLDPNAVMRADEAGVKMGSERELVGASAVAGRFSGQARAAQPALIDGEPGLVWMQRGDVRVVFRFTFEGDTITAIDLIADPETIAGLNLA